MHRCSMVSIGRKHRWGHELEDIAHRCDSLNTYFNTLSGCHAEFVLDWRCDCSPDEVANFSGLKGNNGHERTAVAPGPRTRVRANATWTAVKRKGFGFRPVLVLASAEYSCSLQVATARSLSLTRVGSSQLFKP